MASSPRYGLSLCAGGGGLDMGLGLAEPGFATACFVEIEEYPRTVLAAAQSAGYFHAAPIWDDLKRFSGRPWRGIIDTVLAGYPCQPFSMAGQRKGADDPRHLWPDVARIIREIQPEWVFLENVAGHLTLGLEAVLRELWSMGFTPAVGLFSASETGASHERQRVFILAHRAGAGREDGRRPGVRAQGSEDRARLVAEFERCVRELDNPAGARCDTSGSGPSAERQGGQRLSGDGRSQLGHAPRLGRGEGRSEPILRIGREAAPGAGSAMADAGSGRGREKPHQSCGKDGSASVGKRGRQPAEPCNDCPDLADARQPGPQGGEQPGSPDQWDRAVAHGSTAERGRPWIYPPGPGAADAWADTLATAPDLAPAAGLADCLAWAGRLAAALDREDQEAVEPAVCRMADGLATRARALRLLGNGVAPLAAAYAWRALAAAHGLGPVDLEAPSAGAAQDDPRQPVRRLTP